MRKLLTALAVVGALGAATAVPAFADEATFTKTIRGKTVTCTITYTDDGDGRFGPRDTVSAVTCAIS
ncbi:MAG TPA: hypothetical protein VGM69_09675 [Chloroflexota bacterium]|jgi:uncharacterized cupredoxin-like copper-binding protein